jgi:hypothetical protein
MWTELELSSCEYGCKIYQHDTIPAQVELHNSAYNCPKGMDPGAQLEMPVNVLTSVAKYRVVDELSGYHEALHQDLSQSTLDWHWEAYQEARKNLAAMMLVEVDLAAAQME